MVYQKFNIRNVGSAIGLILPGDLPAEQKEALEDLLLQLIGQTALHVPVPEEPKPAVKERRAEPIPPPPVQTIGSKIAAGLMSGSIVC